MVPDEVDDICTRKRTRPAPMSVYNPPKRSWRDEDAGKTAEGKTKERRSWGKESRLKDRKVGKEKGSYDEGKKNKGRNGKNEEENWSGKENSERKCRKKSTFITYWS